MPFTEDIQQAPLSAQLSDKAKSVTTIPATITHGIGSLA